MLFRSGGFKKRNHLKHYLNVVKEKCYYEILNTTNRKLYFDIDKLNIKRCEFKNFIDTFISVISKEIGEKFELKDFVIHTKTNEKNMIVSIHIISVCYYMDYNKLRYIVKLLNNEEKFKFNNEVIELDECVYSKNRAFCLLDNGKLKYENGEVSVKNTFKFDEINVNAYEEYKYFLISMTKKDMIDTKFIEIYYEDMEKLQKKEEEEAIKFLYIVNEEYDLLEYIFKNHKEDLKRNKFWKPLIFLVKKNDLMSRNEFCSKSLVGKHTYKKNLEYWDALDVNSEENFITNIYDYFRGILRIEIKEIAVINKFKTKNKSALINQFKTKMAEYFNDFIGKFISVDEVYNEMKKKFIKYIITYGNIIDMDRNYYLVEKSIFKEVVNEKNENVIIEEKTNEINTLTYSYSNNNINYTITYNLKNGYIFNSSDRFLYAINYDINYDNDKKELRDMEVIDISETEKFLDEIFNSENKVYGIRGIYGCGKSHYFITPIINKCKEENVNFLLITENNVLNMAMSEKYEINNHKEVNKYENNNYVSSMESLWKILKIANSNNINFKYVIIDEIVSVIHHFKSETITKNREGTYEVFMKIMELLKESEKIIIADADLNYDVFYELFYYLNNHEDYKIYEFIRNPYLDYEFNVIQNINRINKKLIKNIRNNKKICLVNSNKNKLLGLIKTISVDCEEIYNNINIVVFYKDGVLEIKNGVENLIRDEKKFKKIMKNIDEYLIENNFRILAYSPKIKSGLSIQAHFDLTFAYYYQSFKNGISYRIFNQMIFRVRNLNDKKMFIYGGKIKSAIINKFKTIEIIKEDELKLKYINLNKILKDRTATSAEHQELFNNLNLIMKLEQLYSDNNGLYRIVKNLREKNLKIVYLKDDLENEKIIEQKYKNIDLININVSEYVNDIDKLRHIFNKIEDKEKLTYKQELIYEKLNLLLNASISIDFKNKSREFFFKGAFKYEYVKNNYNLIDTPSYVEELIKNISTIRNINKYVNGKDYETNIIKLDDIEHYEYDSDYDSSDEMSKINYDIMRGKKEIENKNLKNIQEHTLINKHKGIFIIRVFKRLLELCKNNKLKTKDFKLTKEEQDNFKAIYKDKKITPKITIKILNKEFNKYIGKCFKYDNNRSGFYNLEISELFQQKRLSYKPITFKIEKNETNKLEDKILLETTKRKCALIKKFKTKKPNIIDNHILIKKYGTHKNSNRIHDLYDKNRILKKSNMYKEYTIDINQKLKDLIRLESLVVSNTFSSDTPIKLRRTHRYNGKEGKYVIFKPLNLSLKHKDKPNTYYSVSNTFRLYEVDDATNDVMKKLMCKTQMSSDIVENVLSFLTTPKYKVCKEIDDKRQYLNDMIKLEPIKRDNTILYISDEIEENNFVDSDGDYEIEEKNENKNNDILTPIEQKLNVNMIVKDDYGFLNEYATNEVVYA